jgi:DNA repair protein RadC
MPHPGAVEAAVNDSLRRVVGEEDVVTPDHYRALCLGVGPQMWADAQMLSQATGMDLAGTLAILAASGGLGALFQMGPTDLERCGVPEQDCPKIAAFLPLASRLLCARAAATADGSTRRQVAEELEYRGLQYSQIVAGVMAWSAQGVRVADRIIAIGTRSEVFLDFPEILRTVISSDGGVSMILWIWRPVLHVVLTPQDRRNTDELRLMASVLNIRVEDVLLVGLGETISLAVTDQWQ